MCMLERPMMPQGSSGMYIEKHVGHLPSCAPGVHDRVVFMPLASGTTTGFLSSHGLIRNAVGHGAKQFEFKMYLYRLFADPYY